VVLVLIGVFVLGYLLITMEHTVKVNKSAIALLTGGLGWTIFSLFSPDQMTINHQLSEHLGSIAEILFFLLGAMTIVELIDAHNGFEIITSRIQQTNKRKLSWSIGLITFFLSAILDNLTTTIVVISMLKKLISDKNDRLVFASIVVIAANAGGAWTPMGDVTTTMLWIGGQITTIPIILNLFLPSLVCLIIPLLGLSFQLNGTIEKPHKVELIDEYQVTSRQQSVVFLTGITALIMVPLFKYATHLPPYMGILIGLGILWVITELMHSKKENKVRHSYSVAQALRKIDTATLLFFFGILMSVAFLQSAGILTHLSAWITDKTTNLTIQVLSLGILSSIIDNVPLVSATQAMFSLEQFPTDSYFWEFLAYSAGTGGSILIFGSAAGVAAMGMEKISFGWYLKKITLFALLGFLSGAFVYIIQNHFLS
jgi:Na+/H+ antiporter NhaD/arsenite permease-like protein